jgi:hypothetical protein
MTWEISLVIGFLGTAFLLIYLADSVGKKERVVSDATNGGMDVIVQDHSYLKLFFIIIGLGFILSGIGIQTQIIDANNETIDSDIVDDIHSITLRQYMTLITTIVFTIGYFIIMWIRSRLNWSREKIK